jgi:cell division GTPase FtsZ
MDLGLVEVNEAMSQIIQSAGPGADVLFGASETPEMNGRAQITLIGTGIKDAVYDPVAVQSLFGVPLPDSGEDLDPTEVQAKEALDSLDVPAFMRRRELFGLKAGGRVRAWAQN